MQKSASASMRRRMGVILALFMVGGFCLLIWQLFKIQIIDGEWYQAQAFRQQTRSQNLGAKRGTIYDRNNNELARSASVWNVCISPAEINQETIGQVAKDLGEILNVTPESIIEQAKDIKSFYKVIGRRVERATMEAVTQYITENKVSGVNFEQDAKRYYTYGSLASSLLGFTNYDGNGAYGLEAYYDKTLSGTPGMVVSTKNARGADMHFKYQQMYEAQDGNSVVLTIDEAIQHFLEKNLETAVIEHSIQNRAAGIVLNVKTGEILAMATKPDFDPNDPYTLQDPAAVEQLAKMVVGSQEYKDAQRQFQYDQWRNKAISDPYEPGSVFKIVTAATALENKKVTINDHFYCSGSIKIASETIHCWQAGGHGDVNFIEGMQKSCNPVFITIGQRTGARLFYDSMQSFGFGEQTGVDLPGEAPGILHGFDTLNKEGGVELASTSFGQTFKVTTIQLASAAAAAVNGGNLMQPYIVKQVLDPDGNVISTTQPTVRRQVISEETSATMRMLVEAVVNGGSGRFSAIPGYQIGGKTGTSEKLDPGAGDVHILSFVGIAPMDDPEIAVLVMLDEPNLGGNAYGSTIAAPVVGAILQETLPYLGFEPQYTAEQLEEREVNVPNVMYKKPHDAQAELTVAGLNTRIIGNGPMVLQQIPLPNQKMPKGSQVILYTEEANMEQEITVPDVVGMLSAEANKLVVNSGLNVQIRGVIKDGVSTVVGEQWPLPGTVQHPGDVVILTLVEGASAEERAADAQANIPMP
ncbi:penicillin-binding transpeptidase domain-containing protein [Oscillospiraceae bacterium MB08-C2-2]|nr:penicillin-binding transpeptidase domain-containing protein [Oscillospiraceae bacterium MB08-C2-2]